MVVTGNSGSCTSGSVQCNDGSVQCRHDPVVEVPLLVKDESYLWCGKIGGPGNSMSIYRSQYNVPK